MGGHPLSGSDVFQLLLDLAMRRSGQAGNISRIEYRLENRTNLSALRNQLIVSPVLNRVNEIRYRTRWFGAPGWADGVANLDKAVILHSESLSEFEITALRNVAINETTGLVRIDLFNHVDESPVMIISMHHVLFDHRGMDHFVKCLISRKLPDKMFADNATVPIRKLWKDAFEVAVFSFRSSGWNLTSIAKKAVMPKAEYQSIEFNESETQLIDENAIECCAGLSKSLFYIAVIMKVFENLANQKKANGDFTWMATPHDMRRKGEKGHLIGNDISFIYFRDERGKSQTLKQIVKSLNEQLKVQIKRKMPLKHAHFLRLYRYVPLWAYKAMTDLAHGGKVSSFAFSDLGEVKSPHEILGAKVVERKYLPPVPSKPGISIVINRENKCLGMMVGVIPEVIPDLRGLAAELRRSLREK